MARTKSRLRWMRYVGGPVGGHALVDAKMRIVATVRWAGFKWAWSSMKPSARGVATSFSIAKERAEARVGLRGR